MILNMIVKNEAHVIARCLRSVVPFIHQAVIVDTGSTDRTIEIVHDELKSVLHVVLNRPWVDFGTNRTQAFQLAQHNCNTDDYALLMDADEELRPSQGFSMPLHLGSDAYGLWSTTPKGGCYLTPKLIRLDRNFYWEGVLHEELKCVQPVAGSILTGLECHGHFDSARNHDPLKYTQDAQLLRSQPLTARNKFYEAQSWRDAGQWEQARIAYEHRTDLGGHQEELWYSFYMLAVCMEKLSRFSIEDVVAAYNKAYFSRTSRAEPLRSLAEYWLKQGNATQHRVIHEVADQVPYPMRDQLFIDPAAYVTRFPEAKVHPRKR